MIFRLLALISLCACFLVFPEASAQTVRVVPQQLSLAAPAGNGSGSVQRFSLAASGPIGAPFTAAVRYLDSAGGWLSVSPTGGTLPSTITVTSDSSRLPMGNYLAQVTVASGATGAVATVALTVVASGTAGSLTSSTSALTFISRFGEQPQPLTFLVAPATRGAPATQFRAVASGGWLSTSPLPFTTPAAVTVTPLISGLGPGVYSGTVTLVPSGGGTPTVVPATLAVLTTLSPANILNLSQTVVSFAHQAGAVAPALQQVDVSSPLGAAEFTAATATPWLRVSSTLEPAPAPSVTAFTPATINVQPNPTGLTPGVYVGTVVVTPTGGAPQELPVSLTVTTTASLNAQPSSLSFEESFGNEAAVVVTSTGGANLAFTATVSPTSPWLSVTPSSGSTGNVGTSLQIRATPGGLPPGVYTGAVTLTVTATGAATTIPVRLTIAGTAVTPATLALSSQNVELVGIAGFGSSPAGVIDVSTNSPNQTHPFTAAAVSETGWLRVDPYVSVAPARLTVSVNPGIADSGPQSGSILVTSLLTGDQLTVPVSLNLTQQALGVEPGSVEFVQPRRGAIPAPVALQIVSNTPSTYSISDAPPWIDVTPNRGFTPGRISVAVNPAGLPPGQNSGSFSVVGPNNRVNVPVSLTVASPPAPALTPTTLSLVYQVGAPTPPIQTISLGSTNEETVTFQASVSTESGVRWLTITPTSGRSPATISVSVNPTLLVPGTHTGTIRVIGSEDSAPRTVQVTATVTASPVIVQSVLHAASLEPTVIAPGKLISIRGAGLGPVIPLTAQPTAAGAYETRLGDIRVLFDGAPAPILFSRHDQVNAIVPYSVQGRVSTRVQVENGGRFSVPLDLRVALTAPGLFAASSNGRGQAAAFNLDFTPNSVLNPVARGSVITLYGTGEGQTDPQGQDGRVITTDLRRPRAIASATIGGVPAEVLYIGSAPDQVSGIFQVNLRVPENIEPGVVPVELRIGEGISQPGVTIVVR